MELLGEKIGSQAQANAPELQARLDATHRALCEQRKAAAAESAAAILDTTSNFRQLAHLFVDAQEVDLLTPLIWARRNTVLRRLSAVAKFMELCDSAQDGETQIRELRAWLLDDAAPLVSFSVLDFLHLIGQKRNECRSRLEKAGNQRLLDLFLLKYRGWNGRSLSENLAALAERCEVPRRLAKLFYSGSSQRDVDFQRWFDDLKSAQAVCHLLRDARSVRLLLKDTVGPDHVILNRFCIDAKLSNHVDVRRAKQLFGGLDTSRGLVLCTFHCAYLFVLYELLLKFMPDHYTLSKFEIRTSGRSGKEAGHRGAAFRAMKALMQKRTMLIAPDGPCIDDMTSEEIKVFGMPTRISFSPALFAYEAQSNLGWCSLIHRDGQLVPRYVPGPTRKSGETFAQFKDRWLSFYSAQLEKAFSSNPKSLALNSGRWVSFGLKAKEVSAGAEGVSNNLRQ